MKYHGLKEHLKSSKNEKVKAIIRHCLQQMNPITTGQTAVIEQNDNRGKSSGANESVHDSLIYEYESDVTDSDSLHSLLHTRKMPMSDQLQHASG